MRFSDKELKSVKIFWQKLGEKYNGRIFAVLGNYDIETVANYLQNSGVDVLDNENRRIWMGQESIHLVGVDDPFTGRDNLLENGEGSVLYD